MAITMRIGKESEFDPNKMVPGEWAVSTDTRYVRMCFAPGIVMRMATYESFESDMVQIKAILAECKSIQSAIQRIQSEVNAKASITIEYANAAAESAEKAAESEAKAKMYAENAEAVTGIKIATQTTAGIIKGGENYIDESGELQLTKRTDSPTLYNSYAGGIKLNELGGVSEQDSTTGAQLFDGNLTNALYTNGAWEAESTVYRSIEIEVETAGSYSISFETEVMINREDGAITEKQGTHFVFDFEVGTHIISFRKNPSAEWGTGMNIMLNAGLTALPWEPYTGNAASPNPDYPQEIKSVVVGEIKTYQNSLWDDSKKHVGYIGANGTNYPQNSGVNECYSDYVDLKNAKKLYCHCEATITIDKSSLWIGIGFYDSNKVFISRHTEIASAVPSGTKQTIDAEIEIPENTVYARISARFFDDGKMFVGTEQSCTIILSDPITLNGVGTAQDKIVRKDSVWKIERNAKRHTAQSTGVVYNPLTLTKQLRYTCPSDCKLAKYMCTMGHTFIYYPWDTDVVGLFGFGGTTESDRAFAILLPADADITEYETMDVLYQLKEPTYEDLPTADQIALNSLVSYDGITYLYCDSEVQPTWDLEYGTSRVGGYTLEAWNTAMSEKILNEARYNEIVAAMLVMNQE